MSDNVNLELLGAHITRLRADMSEAQNDLARLNSEGAAIISNVTELSLKVAHIERAIGDFKSYVDHRTVEVLKYGLGMVQEELTTSGRQRGRSGT